jgi:hypothetical protein
MFDLWPPIIAKSISKKIIRFADRHPSIDVSKRVGKAKRSVIHPNRKWMLRFACWLW